MNPEPLPDVYRAALDDATFDAYLRDLRALDGPLEVRTKQAAGRYADETAWTLDDAVAALTSGSVRAIQVRYRLASDIWCDTIMGGGHGAPRQLVRMAALVVALFCALPEAAMGQEPQPQQDGQAAEPASDDSSDAPDLSGGPAVGVEGATDASSDDPEPSAPVEPPAAPAEDTFPLGWYVDAFTRPEVRTGYDELGQTDNDLVRFRFRFALFLRPLELGRVRVSARFEPQAGGAWSSGATLVDATLGLHQGFVTIANDRVSVQLGRQELSYGEHLVIGAVPWHQLGRAFDAAKVRVDLGGHGAWLDVFGAQVVELGDNGFGDGDAFLLGAYAAVGGLISESLSLDVYLLEQLRGAEHAGGVTVAPGLHRSTLGARAKQRVGSLDYRAEAGVQLGRTGSVKLRAFQVDAEAGVTVAREHLRLSVEGFYASGDRGGAGTNQAWDQLYPTAHAWLGFTDIIGGRSNITGAVFHLQANATSELRFTLDAHLFARPEPNGLAGDGLAAFEADIGARWQIAQGLALRANYSLFQAFTDAFPVSDLAHFAELELRFTH